jgi:hypothetical protein
MADENTPIESYPFEFRALVVQALEANGLALKEWRDDGLEVERDDGQMQFVGLANLYRRVVTSPAEMSAELVRNFFRHAHVADADQLGQTIPDNIDDAPDRVRARLTRTYGDADHAPWCLPIDPDGELAVCLVLDFPTMMAFVTKPMADRTATPMAEWVARGVQHLRDTAPEGWLQPLHPEQGIWVGHANDSYDAARALILCDTTPDNPLGWVVAVPTRDWLFARPVDREGLQFVHLLKLRAEWAFGEQPYPISDQVYWVRPGHRWVKIPMQFDGDRVMVTLPPELIDALGLEFTDEGGEGDEPPG